MVKDKYCFLYSSWCNYSFNKKTKVWLSFIWYKVKYPRKCPEHVKQETRVYCYILTAPHILACFTTEQKTVELHFFSHNTKSFSFFWEIAFKLVLFLSCVQSMVYQHLALLYKLSSKTICIFSIKTHIVISLHGRCNSYLQVAFSWFGDV